MPTVTLDDKEWNVVMQMLATQPWRDVNPLLMKIGNQLRAQAELTNIPRQTNTKQQTNNEERPMDS